MMPLPGLSSAFHGLTITHISDLHIGSFGELERRLVRKLRKQTQELIAITGDFTDNDAGIEATLRTVSLLSAAHGIWAVPGNRDYYGNYNHKNPPPIFDLLRGVGVRVLVNEHAPAVRRAGEDLFLLGVDDPIHNFADLGAALRGLPGETPRILLAHAPDIMHDGNFRQVTLALVGHTHGGQIRLPLVPPAIGHSDASMTFSAGLYRLGATRMYVNRGIGTSRIPLRFACPPEITYLHLMAL